MGAITAYHADLLQGRQAFIRGHEGLFLWNVGAKFSPKMEDTTPGTFIGFNTTFVNRSDKDGPDMRDFAVLPVRKRDSNAFHDRISVGRAPNCDIVVRLQFISKLHAHFTVRADGGYQITDAGSANGTAVNNRLLRTGEALPVALNDVVRFGSAEFRLTDAAKLYDVLTPLLRG